MPGSTSGVLGPGPSGSLMAHNTMRVGAMSPPVGAIKPNPSAVGNSMVAPHAVPVGYVIPKLRQKPVAHVQPQPHTPPDPQEKTKSGSKKSTIIVFVGNLCESAPSRTIRSLLATCGRVVSWKRTEGTEKKPSSFGYCEYSKPEFAVRAIRLLHNRLFGGQRLVVKADAKSKVHLENYQEANANKYAENESRLKDSKAKKDIDVVIRESEPLLATAIKNKTGKATKSDTQIKPPKNRKEDGTGDNDDFLLDNTDIAEDTKNIIQKEIGKFKKRTEELERGKKRHQEQNQEHKEKEHERKNETSRHSRSHNCHNRSRSRAQSRSREKDSRKKSLPRRRSTEREHSFVNSHKKLRSPSPLKVREHSFVNSRKKSRSRLRSREREHSFVNSRKRSRSRLRSREREHSFVYSRKKSRSRSREKEHSFVNSRNKSLKRSCSRERELSLLNSRRRLLSHPRSREREPSLLNSRRRLLSQPRSREMEYSRANSRKRSPPRPRSREMEYSLANSRKRSLPRPRSREREHSEESLGYEDDYEKLKRMQVDIEKELEREEVEERRKKQRLFQQEEEAVFQEVLTRQAVLAMLEQPGTSSSTGGLKDLLISTYLTSNNN